MAVWMRISVIAELKPLSYNFKVHVAPTCREFGKTDLNVRPNLKVYSGAHRGSVRIGRKIRVEVDWAAVPRLRQIESTGIAIPFILNDD